MAVDTSRSPYFNDYKEDKHYHELLFRPRRAVQVRELNQIQTMFNKQVERFANHVFEEGSMVIPGETSYDLNFSYAKVNISNYDNIFTLLSVAGITLIGQTTGVEAELVRFVQPEGTDPATFYLKYVSASTDGETGTFKKERVNIVDANGVTIGTANVIETGNGSKFTVNAGVYYINGRFVLNETMTILLDKYAALPTYSVGFLYQESVVTSTDDPSLNDNAQGSPNFTAPGADRLKVDLELAKFKPEDAIPDNFIQIFKISNGELQKKARTSEYSVLGDVLAQRTYDQSGNYTVDGFGIDLKEHLSQDNKQGLYTEEQGGDESKFIASINPGKAYVIGYEAINESTKNIGIEKARDTEVANNSSISAQMGYFIQVDNVESLPSVSSYERVRFLNSSGNIIGRSRVKFIRRSSSDSSTCFLHVFDMKDNQDQKTTAYVEDIREVQFDGNRQTLGTVSEENAYLQGTSYNGLIYPLQVNYVKSLLNKNGQTDTSFTVIRQFDSTVGSNGTVVFTAPTNESFVNQNPEYAFASFTDQNDSGIMDITGMYSLSGTPSGRNIIVDFGTSQAGRSVRLFLQVSKQQAIQKSKVPTEGTVTATTDSDGVLKLKKADAYELISVIDEDGADRTASFMLYPNRTASFYDVSYVKADVNITKNLTVNFRYFVHGSGDFFSVDSYSGIAYEEIPFENGYSLSDVIDFRPRINDNGTGFTGTGAISTNLPIPYSIIRSDMEYYLARVDKVYIKTDGTFGVTKGTPAVNPEEPKDKSQTLSLYALEIPPYTVSVKDIDITSLYTQRYTMEDIGLLERRIENIEYYVSLNLLEKSAADMQVFDETTGLNRFKNGFLVDSFEDHSVGDYGWSQYHCAIGDGELRPEMNLNAVDMEYSGEGSGIKISNNMVTLDYEENALISQNLRSRVMNVNPYAVYRWEGEVELSPSVDNWVDVKYTQPNVINKTVRKDVNSADVDQAWRNSATVVSSSTSKTSKTVRPHGDFINPAATGSLIAEAQKKRPDKGNFDATKLATKTTTTTTKQTLQRTSTSESSGGTKTLNSTLLPYMRSIEVQVKGKGHKPKTRLYFFFDDVNVNEYIRPIDSSINGTTVRTDEEGSFEAVFTVPNNDKNRFTVGTKPLVAIDDPDNKKELSLSFGKADYTAHGREDTNQKTIIRTRTVETAKVTDTSTNTTSWYDPLAQSFLIENRGGTFVTKLDLHFSTKDKVAPVNVDIREMENGMPTQRIVPGSRSTLYPREVNVSDDGSAATTFNFKYPVYLEEGREYCFVIWANSVSYNVFIATMGEKDKGTGQYISKQPYLGVMFKSQNSSTWTEDQNSDIQFTLYNARFNKGNGTLNLKNKELPTLGLQNNPFKSIEGSNLVEINKKKHGYVKGSVVTVSGAKGTTGIADDVINGSHEVVSVKDINTVVIDVGNEAALTNLFGGNSVRVSDSYMVSFINMNCNDVSINDTDIAYYVNGMTGKSIDGEETPYKRSNETLVTEKGSMVGLKNPWMVTNKNDEEENYNGDSSLTVSASMVTTNENISPVIDLDSFNIICPYYAIDGKDEDEADGSNTFNKYRTRISGLANTSNSIRAYMDCVSGENTDVLFSARFGNSQEEVEDSDWQMLKNVKGNPASNSLSEIEFKLDKQDGVQDYTYFQVMIQFKSKSCTKIPVGKSLRIICLGT